MLDFLGRWTYRARWAVLAGALLFLAGAGAWGSSAFDHLTGSGFTYAGSESARADELGYHSSSSARSSTRRRVTALTPGWPLSA